MIHTGRVKWGSAPSGTTHVQVISNGHMWEKFEENILYTWTESGWHKDGPMDKQYMDKSPSRLKRPGS